MKLLIHHHTVAYLKNDEIWAQSFIIVWINELAKYFTEIGLLLSVSSSRTELQDSKVTVKNVKLHSLGYRNEDRSTKNRNIKNVCNQVSKHYDCLLIRGITPKQGIIFKNCHTKYKYFLLVGSIKDSKPHFSLIWPQPLIWILYYFRMLQLKNISKKSHVFANSPFIVKELKEVLGIEAKFIATNSISIEDFKDPNIIKPKNKNPTLLFCGRVVKDKGIEELIYSISILKKKQINCKLNIVGSVNNAYKQHLIKLSESYGVNQSIHFHGFIPFGKDLFKFYQNADIYILPSWHEGFPHSIWEAAMHLTPIITTNVGGIPGLISKDDSIMIPPKKPELICQSIEFIIDNPETTNLRVLNAYNLAKKFTVENCARQLSNFISTAKAIQ